MISWENAFVPLEKANPPGLTGTQGEMKFIDGVYVAMQTMSLGEIPYQQILRQ